MGWSAENLKNSRFDILFLFSLIRNKPYPLFFNLFFSVLWEYQANRIFLFLFFNLLEFKLRGRFLVFIY